MELENRNAATSCKPHRRHHDRDHDNHPHHHRHRQQRVRGLATGTISVPLSKAWRVIANFYGLHSWVPTIRKCYEIRPGVRYAESIPGTDGKVHWVEEQLTSYSAAGHNMSYKIVAGNFGLQDYSATLKLSDSCGGGGGGKTFVHWSFAMSSQSQRTKEQQELYLRQGIQSLERAARRIL